MKIGRKENNRRRRRRGFLNPSIVLCVRLLQCVQGGAIEASRGDTLRAGGWTWQGTHPEPSLRGEPDVDVLATLERQQTVRGRVLHREEHLGRVVGP